VLPVMLARLKNGRQAKSVVSAIHQDLVLFACARPSPYECGHGLTSGELDYRHHVLQEAGEPSSSSADQPEHQSRAPPGSFWPLPLARISCPLLLPMLGPSRKRDFSRSATGLNVKKVGFRFTARRLENGQCSAQGANESYMGDNAEMTPQFHRGEHGSSGNIPWLRKGSRQHTGTRGAHAAQSKRHNRSRRLPNGRSSNPARHVGSGSFDRHQHRHCRVI
jgi:hypothetical protein